MHNQSRIGYGLLSLIVPLVLLSPTLASAPAASGHFEVYCDGVGLFLNKIEGVPASGKLVFFSRLGHTFGDEYVGQGSGRTDMCFVMGASPMASARASLMAGYG
jgi:hypothetical protein